MFAWRAFPWGGESPELGPAGPGGALVLPGLEDDGIRAAFTTRHGGVSEAPWASLNLSFLSGDDEARVRANRARALASIRCAPEAWTSARQVHGVRAAGVGPAERGSGSDGPASALPRTDALWTDDPGTVLAVLTADCAPVLLADRRRRRLGVVHAGWRGIVGGVIAAALSSFDEPREVVAAVGPAIGPCCYEVGEEVASAARAALGDDVVRAREPRPFLDLWGACLSALRAAGVRDLALAAVCTKCESHRFYSHRAGDTGRQGLVAVLEAG